MVLNAAKLGMNFKGVVSFHGGLAGVPASPGVTKGKILVCHGGADKFISDSDIKNFKDNLDAVKWFKQARYEGRNEVLYHEDDIKMLGWNMYMTPQQASHGLALMQNYPVDVPDLGEHNGYRDLTEFTVFKNYNVIE